MADNASIVAAMVGVLGISGYGVKIVDRAQLLARDSLRVVTAAQAMFEAIRAHRVQRQRELELGMHLPVVPTDENLKQMAEQYVGMSREDARAHARPDLRAGKHHHRSGEADRGTSRGTGSPN
ncbi:hypothetical protein PINS_up015124 [Pythium insidiosum]|nr:hypothetical protein PINS_up015124 [Pythium insidiosum]